MIIPIQLNADDIISQFSVSRQQVLDMEEAVVKGLALGFYQKWVKEAEKALHSTRSRYIANIKIVDTGKLEGTVLLDLSKDPLIGMIELGASAFDMKTAMLKSSKVKYDKKGNPYITIPFRWGTPGAIGDSDVFSGIMPEEVYDLVKKKPTTIAVPGGGNRSRGLSATDLANTSASVRQGGTRKAIVDSKGKTLFDEYARKSSLYQGMIKQIDAATGQSRYNTFRRISLNSDPNAFIHPGIQNYNLLQKALGAFDIPTETGALLDNELIRLGLMNP